MTDRYPTGWIAGGLIVSATAHALIILPLLTSTLTAQSKMSHLEEDYDEPPPPNATSPDPPPVGIDTSDEATLTWIGYEQYQQHLARLARTEQAALDAGAAAQMPSPPPLPPPPAPKPSPPTPHASPPRPATTTTAPDQPDPAPEAAPAQAPPSPDPPPPTTPSPEPAPVPAPEIEPVDDPGQADDSDADPTSTIEVPRDHWVTGRPIARQGITLKPRKPDFSVIQRLTSRRPGDVPCELVFDPTGKPASARLLISTGNTDIDFVILSNLYRWRARGDRIDALTPGDTITLKIVLSFSR